MNDYDHNRGKSLSRNARSQTGCVGISIVRSASGRRDGTVLTYFSVHARKTNGKASNRKFCVETLGRQEAWRRALKFRAEHEQKVTANARQ
jgi:hypothetical protein